MTLGSTTLGNFIKENIMTLANQRKELKSQTQPSIPDTAVSFPELEGHQNGSHLQPILLPLFTMRTKNLRTKLTILTAKDLLFPITLLGPSITRRRHLIPSPTPIVTRVTSAILRRRAGQLRADNTIQGTKEYTRKSWLRLR